MSEPVKLEPALAQRRGRIPEGDPPGLVAMVAPVFAFLGGAAAWALHLVVAYALVEIACQSDRLSGSLLGLDTAHVFLMFVVAPLLVLGAPLVPLLWALPRGAQRRLGRGWNARPWLGRAWHALTGPVVVWCVLTATLWVWHLPGPYQAAVRLSSVHALEHATMLGASLLFWWVVLQSTGHRRVDGGSALLLVFTTKVQSATLGAIITFVPNPIYPVYEAGAALAGMTPMQDQHLAGLIMGTAGGLVLLAAAAYVFLSWLASIERRHLPAGAKATPRVVRAPPLERAPRRV